MISPSAKLSAASVFFALAWGIPQIAVADKVPQQQQPRTPATSEQFHRTVVLKSALQGIEGKKMQAWLTELAPGAVIGEHYHPYDEFVYVLDGRVTLQVKGQNAQTLQMDQIGHVPARTVHHATNDSDIYPAKVLVFGLTTEGEPLATPVK